MSNSSKSPNHKLQYIEQNPSAFIVLPKLPNKRRMRVKKQRRHRKFLRFYTACYGFREPYKILCDGTFVYHLLAHKITPADEALSNILGGARVKLFTTKCVLAELKRLGSSHSQTLQAANQLMVARCDHETVKSADMCLNEIIGKSNTEHFFVATTDNDMRKSLREIPGVPVIYGLRNALFLEQPSVSQRQFIKTIEEDRLHMKTGEYKILRKRTKEILGGEDERVSADGEEALEDVGLDMPVVKTIQSARIAMEAKDRVQFKRKRAKGPNPLSCKKRKNENNSNPVTKGNKDSENTARKRNRKRKRSHKKEMLPAES